MGTDITVTAADGGTFAAYLALPATTPAPGIVLLPEVFNTNDHIRAVVDGYAEDGFTVLAPDVYWREEAGNYLPYTDEGRAKAQSLRGQMDTDQYASDLGDTVAALAALMLLANSRVWKLGAIHLADIPLAAEVVDIVECPWAPWPTICAALPEARYWADQATAAEHEAYCLAAFEAMAPARQAAFLSYVGRAAS